MLSNSSNSSNLFSFSYRKVYGYVAIILIVLLMSWEYQKVDAALHMESIPEESIRLRILANSDSPNDQLIKAVVRDEVVAAMNSWITEPLTIEEAREVLMAHESELQDVIANTLANNGYKYGFTTEIGQVEFPTKMYGQLVYPAGMYEALLITLGEGAGRNWWCVLFPPLCFADTVSGEATADPSVETAVATTTSEVETDSEATTDVEVDFFIVELFEDFGAWISSLFA
ncbi:MAG: stage II sporulation protein R [Candidatus Pristimantibacillus lignocellulolyticus]|uniref:Stage II sporulation protein R n=1 Tax=Candidatus Pristimantibacillus lignocellulolyticus TaxID=2994561 RepID=A0A9J6ZIL9_9BACL|nr:MAG: stage II sporulation protein R [Candidatus Pristimantibacillus lignocellulolyticus]